MPNDAVKRRALIDRCNAHAAKHGGLPAVSIEQFFDGNQDLGSILCNRAIADLGRIRDQLLAIRGRPDVEAVLVRIHETMADDASSWPFAEQVILVTRIPAHEVPSLFHESMAPDEVWELAEPVPGVPAPRPGSKALVAWWD